MSRDFALLASPATARRLLLLHRVTQLALPDGLDAVAAQDQLTEADFDPLICAYSTVKRLVAQFLLDNDMRGIVSAHYHPEIDELTLLYIVRLSGKPVSIITRRAGAWRRHIKTLFIKDIVIRSPTDIPGEWIDERRHGALILDLADSDRNWLERHDRFIREFPRTILYQGVNLRPPIHWTGLASRLFPMMPHPISLKLLSDTPKHWKKIRICDYALLYNVCLFPEYIHSSKTINLDDNIQEVLEDIILE